MTYPLIQLTKSRRFMAGHPWVFSNEINMDAVTKALPVGGLVRIANETGKVMAVGYFNPHTLIAIRILARADIKINADWFKERFEAALARRAHFATPHYRLIHSEGDECPGLIVDRYDDVFVIQLNTAGMEQLKPFVVEALSIFSPKAIVIRNDGNSRTLEDLPPYAEVIGTLPEQVYAIENGLKFSFDPMNGQKTGWFYDQRSNRRNIQNYVKGKTVLDVFSYSGSFAIHAMAAGAKSAVCIDRSKEALESAQINATLNQCKIEGICDNADRALVTLAEGSKKYDVVLLDPPAFAKVKKDVPGALRAYVRYVKLACDVLNANGLLSFICCSHHITADDLRQSIVEGVRKSGRNARIIQQFASDADHPIHLQLPESSYLKGFLLYVD